MDLDDRYLLRTSEREVGLENLGVNIIKFQIVTVVENCLFDHRD